MIVDARGLGCPKPVIMAEETLSKIDEGIVDVLVDNEASVKNLARFATKNAFYSEAVQENGFWHVKIVKGYPCEAPQEKAGGRPAEAEISAEEPAKEVEKDVFLVIATETMGKNEALGRTLMKGFFETMKVYREVPHTIFFVNTGVKLTTTNDEIIPVLKEIEEMGVEIFSCGTCLDYFNLTSELKVGFRGGTTNLLEGMKDFQKFTWIG